MLPYVLSYAIGLSLLRFTCAQYTGDAFTDENLQQFRSRPDLYPPRLFVDTSEDGITPGYIFMAPYQSYQNSAAIYQSDGTLIWYGFGLSTANNVHDFRVCQYNGTDHLCFFEGEQYEGYARGQAVVLDTTLKPVTTVSSLNGRAPIDQHEFNIINNTGSALVTIYQPQPYDLSAFNITDGQGWIEDCLFQDINTTTNELMFEWSAIEHVALTESYVDPNQSEVAGTGFSPLSPWDYFHINAVDKSEDGDYLISSRHTSTLFKINGTDGSIIWRCGGKLSDFELLNGLNWSYQHDARWVQSSDTVDIISFFDNASNGFNKSADHSAGYIISIDHGTNTVDLVNNYPAPEDLTISDSQGNLQILNPSNWSDSNVFLGWGSQPTVTEQTSDGTIIYRAAVAADGKMNYRGYKFNITIMPHDSPALYTYSQDGNSSTVYYMSWNGATELARWRIYGRAGCDDDWTLVDEVDKTDFETNYTSQGYQEFGMVEAVGANGTGLRNSTNRGVKAFVPSSAISGSCNGDGCDAVTAYASAPGQAIVAETESGCPALAIQTSTSTADNANNSQSNGVAHIHPHILSAISVGVAVTCFFGLVL